MRLSQARLALAFSRPMAEAVRLRAERRAGEMLRELATEGLRATPNDTSIGSHAALLPGPSAPTLADFGFSRKVRSTRFPLSFGGIMKAQPRHGDSINRRLIVSEVPFRN